MNQFLDQILNPVPSIRRKSQTQNNNQIKRNIVHDRKQNDIMFDENHSQQNNYYEEYEKEEVTEQIMFQEDVIMNSFNHENVQRQYHENGQRQFQYLEEQQRGFQHYKRQAQVNGIVMQSMQHLHTKKIFNPEIVQQLLNGINSAKQTHGQFLNWFSNEKSQFNQTIQQTIKQIHFKIIQTIKTIETKHQQDQQQLQSQLNSQLQMQSKNNTNNGQQMQSQQENQNKQFTMSQPLLSMQGKWDIEKKLIKEQLQQRYQYRIQKLEQQLEEKLNYEHQAYPKSLSSNRQSQNQPLQNQEKDKFNEEIYLLRAQLQGKDKLIEELEMENQTLNEHIFDVEQKIQGIELQVQTRVRQRVKQLENQHSTTNQLQTTHKTQLHPILQSSSHLQQSTKVFGIQSMNLNSPQLNDLLKQNQQLKQKLQSLQYEKVSIENQLKEHQKIINFREQQIKQNQHDINLQWAQIDHERHALLLREQQLTNAQENISKQISQIRLKQSELQSLKNDLHKRQATLQSTQQQINRRILEITDRQNQFNLKLERQNFQKEQKQNYSKKSRLNIQQFNAEGGGSFRQKDADIPQLPIGRKLNQQQDSRQQKSFQHYKGKGDFMKGNLQKSFEDMDKSYSRHIKDRQRQVIAGNVIRPTRQSHQYLLPQNSKIQQQQSRSKSKSREKNILRNNFNPSSASSTYKSASYKPGGRQNDEFYQNKPASNLDGLGSKLQRLRDEIKREIDSIK